MYVNCTSSAFLTRFYIKNLVSIKSKPGRCVVTLLCYLWRRDYKPETHSVSLNQIRWLMWLIILLEKERLLQVGLCWKWLLSIHALVLWLYLLSLHSVHEHLLCWESEPRATVSSPLGILGATHHYRLETALHQVYGWLVAFWRALLSGANVLRFFHLEVIYNKYGDSLNCGLISLQL